MGMVKGTSEWEVEYKRNLMIEEREREREVNVYLLKYVNVMCDLLE